MFFLDVLVRYVLPIIYNSFVVLVLILFFLFIFRIKDSNIRILFFFLPLVVYLAILPWSAIQRPPDGDAPHYLLLTHSLAFDFDTDLSNNYQDHDSLHFMDRQLEVQPGDPVGRDGELYSRHNMLLPVVLAPLYRLEGLIGALIVMGVLTALTSWLALALAYYYFRGPPDSALVAWAILSFTAPFLLYSYQVWVEIPAALLVLVALLQIHRLRGEALAKHSTWWGLVTVLTLLPLLKIRFLFIAGSLALLALWQAGKRHRKTAVLILACMLLLALGTLLFNQLVFQNPLKYHDIDGVRTYFQSPAKYLVGFIGLFFDCAFGLFANAPIWLLLLPSLILIVRLRHRIFVDTLVVFLPYFLLLLPRGEWFGAWSPPFRYGVVMLPMLALWLIPLLAGEQRPGSRALLATLGALTLPLTVLWIVIPGWTYNLAHGRSHILDQISILISSDVARLFASSVRIRAATYIWPLVSLTLIFLLWRFGRRGTGRSAAAFGIALALLVPPVFVATAENRASRVVEFEDPWLTPQGGIIYPETWVVYRPQFRGGWLLPAGASIRAPIVSGGDRFDLQVDLLLRPEGHVGAVLEVSDSDGRLLAERVLDPSSDWFSVLLEDLPWTDGNQLLLKMRDSTRDGAPDHHVIVDRALISWY